MSGRTISTTNTALIRTNRMVLSWNAFISRSARFTATNTNPHDIGTTSRISWTRDLVTAAAYFHQTNGW